MFTTAPCFLLLFVSRVFANILVRSKSSHPQSSSPSGQVSDVYDSQSQCDTSVDVVRSTTHSDGGRNSSASSRSVQEQQRGNTMYCGPAAARPVQRECYRFQQSVPILPRKRDCRPSLTDRDHQQPPKSLCPPASGAHPRLFLFNCLRCSWIAMSRSTTSSPLAHCFASRHLSIHFTCGPRTVVRSSPCHNTTRGQKPSTLSYHLGLPKG